MNLITMVLDSLGIVTIVGGSILALASRLPKETITNQKDLIASWEKRWKDMERQRNEDQAAHARESLENAKAIADLQGQIKVYKELPLQVMAKTMQEISASNQEILKTLQKSAETLAHDNETTMQGTAEVALELKKKV